MHPSLKTHQVLSLKTSSFCSYLFLPAWFLDVLWFCFLDLSSQLGDSVCDTRCESPLETDTQDSFTHPSIHSFRESVPPRTATADWRLCPGAGGGGTEFHPFPCLLFARVLLKCRFWCSGSGVPRKGTFFKKLLVPLVLLVPRLVSILVAVVIGWELDARLVPRSHAQGARPQVVLLGKGGQDPCPISCPQGTHGMVVHTGKQCHRE